MSGRLVILPHKSWNVWNQDNREKVARDERLNREELEGKERKEKECVQEHNLEQLLGFKRDTSDKNDVDVVEESNNDPNQQPFRLFGDLEEQERKNQEQLAAKKLQEEKELLAKRRAGIAPWALGDGLAEMTGTNQQPWYLKKQQPQSTNDNNIINNSSSSGSSGNGVMTVNEIVAKERDELLKVKLDPMRRLLKAKRTVDNGSNCRGEMDSNRVLALLGGPTANEFNSSSSSSSSGSKLESSSGISGIKGSPLDMIHPNDVHKSNSSNGVFPDQKHDNVVLDNHNDHDKHHHHHHEKHKKHKDKDKEKDKEKKKEKKRKSDSDHREDEPSCMHTINQWNAERNVESIAKPLKSEEHDDVMSALRRKRLDREQVERRRASLLLAQVEMYGTAGLDEKNVRYHSQYNPTLARPSHK